MKKGEGQAERHKRLLAQEELLTWDGIYKPGRKDDGLLVMAMTM